MPQPKKGPRLGGSSAHQRLMLSNLATALFEHGRITTTETRARTLRPLAEKLITKAKKAELGTVESIHHRREVLKTIHDKSVVHALFTEIAPTFAERPGGYTRITKIGPRKGDNAPMAVIELVTEAYEPSKQAAASRKAPVSTEKQTPAPAATDESSLVDQDAREEESGETVGPDADLPVGSEPADGPDPVIEESADSVEPAPGTDDPQTAANVEDAAPVSETKEP